MFTKSTGSRTRGHRPLCPESGKALGLTRREGQLFNCLLCGARVRVRADGEHLVVAPHRIPRDPRSDS